MARDRDTRDTDPDDYEINDAPLHHVVRRRTRTPIGVEVDPISGMRAEVDRLRDALRPLEELAIVLRGGAGQPGALDDLRGKVLAMRAELAAVQSRLTDDITDVANQLKDQRQIVDGLRQVHWKILAAGTMSGAIVAAGISLAKLFL